MLWELAQAKRAADDAALGEQKLAGEYARGTAEGLTGPHRGLWLNMLLPLPRYAYGEAEAAPVEGVDYFPLGYFDGSPRPDGTSRAR